MSRLDDHRLAFESDISSRRGSDAITSRCIFADWLDENGFDDEATEQRSWTLSRQESLDWLREFSTTLGSTLESYGSEGDDDWTPITYEMMMDAARENLAGGAMFVQRGDTTAQDAMRTEEECKRFWEHYARVTGTDEAVGREEGIFGWSC